MGALSFAVTNGGRQSANANKRLSTFSDLYTQAQSIRSAVMNCALVYDTGNNAETILNASYPASPADVDGDANTLNNVECPGADLTSIDRFIWNGANGRFVPAPPAGVQVEISITSPATEVLSAMQDVVNRMNGQAELLTVGTVRTLRIWVVKNS
jgi:hypothetical protein